MNHIYRLKRSGRSQELQAVPETARTAGKGSRTGKTLAQAVASAVASVVLGGMVSLGHAQQAPPSPPSPTQLPQGGVVSRGSASIASSTSGGTALMSVNQSSQRAVIDWTSFNVGSQAKVQFNQPGSSAVVLNNILGHNASQIYGQISANGQVFLSNPNGVYFSPTAQVNVGGLVATTGKANADEFMAGKATFNREGSTGSVVNEGQLKSALGGYVALLAPEVRNQGVVVAQAGTVALASGEAITLNFSQNALGLAGITTTPQTIASLIDNRSAVRAEGGQIILSAHALATLQGSVIKNSGQLNATSLTEKGGKIVLMADNIELSGTSQIEANGPQGGGTVLVGGDWQGRGDVRQAVKVTMAQGAIIDANATQQGAGGKVVLWSDVHHPQGVTQVDGRIEAKAAGNGNGGQVETSGHTLNVGEQISVNTRAAGTGQAGQWLLDPANVTITTADSNYTNTSGSFTPNGSVNAANIRSATIEAALVNGDVTITTTNSPAGLGLGTIEVRSPIAWASAYKLTLIADAYVYGAGNITINSAGGNLTINQAGSGGTSYQLSGVISGSGSLTKLGSGTLSLSGANTFSGDITISAGTLALTRNASYTISNKITGSGVLQLDPSSSTSTLTLSGNNDYTGGTKITRGTFKLDSMNAFGTVGSIDLGLGKLQFSANNTMDYSGRLMSSSNNFDIDTNGQDVKFSSAFGGVASVNVWKRGSGTLTLAANNTFSGQAYVYAGSLQIGDGGTAGSTGLSTIRVASGSTLVFNRSGASTFNSDIVQLSSTSGTVVFKQASSSDVMTYGGSTSGISNAISVVQEGPGTLLFAAAGISNSFTGGITINAGTLKVGSNSSIGAIGTGAIVNNGILELANLGTAWQSSVQVQKIFTNNISGTGRLISSDTSTLGYSLTGTNTFTGGVTLAGGILNLGSAGAIGTSGAITFGGGTLQFSASNTQDYSARFDTTANQAYRLHTNGQTVTLGSALTSFGGSLTKLGTGTLDLAAANTYTGATTVSAGTLAVSNADGLGATTGGTAVAAGATLDLRNVAVGGEPIDLTGALSTTTGVSSLSGNVVLRASGANNLTVAADSQLTLSGAVSGAFTLAKAGAGRLTLAGTNSYSTTTFSAGILRLANNAALPDTSLTVNAGNTLELGRIDGDDLSVAGKTLSLATSAVSAGGGFLRNVAGQNTWSGAITLNNNSVLTIETGTSLNLSSLTSTVANNATTFFNLTDGNLNFGKLTGTGSAGYIKSGAGTLSGNLTGLTGKTGVYVRAWDSTGAYSSTYGSSPGYSWAFFTSASGTTVVGGLVSGTDFSGAPGYSGAPTSTSNVGSYPITTTVSGLTLSNASYYLYGAGSATNWTVTPKPIAVTLTPAANTYDGVRTYQNIADAATLSPTLLVGSDSIASVTRTPQFSGVAQAGSFTITPSNVVMGAGSSSNYSFTYVPATATVAKANLTVTATSGTRAYGDPNPTLTAVVDGFVGGETLATSGVTGAGTATTTATNTTPAGSTVSVAVGVGTLAATNYDFSNLVHGTLTITKANLTKISATKEYDSLQSVTAAQMGTVFGVNDESFIPASGTASISDKNVATVGKTITSLSGLTLNGVNGSLSSNYNLTSNLPAAGVNNSVTITPKQLTVTGLSVASSRTYDGTRTATPTGSPLVAGTVAVGSGSASDGLMYVGDTVNISGTPTGTYNTKDVATANQVTFGGMVSSNSNYTLTGSQAATITPKQLTVTGLSVPSSRTYDGTQTATPTGSPLLAGTVAVGSGSTSDGLMYQGDAVSISGTPTGTYNSKDVATASQVIFGGLTSSNSNYTLTGSQAATITPKQLTVTGLSVASSRTYDGTQTATPTGSPILAGTVSVGSGSTSDGLMYQGDAVSISGTPTGTYNSKDVATASQVSFSGLSSSNSNYTLNLGMQNQVSITPKQLTVTGLSVASSRTYDGTQAAIVTGTAALTGSVAVGSGTDSDGLIYVGDTATISGTPMGTYNSKDVATASQVNFGGLTSSNSNYTLTGSQAATITPKQLTVTGLSVASSRTYDGTQTATVTGTAALTGSVDVGSGTDSDGLIYVGDTATISGTPMGIYNSKNVALASQVSFSGLSSSNSNYTLNLGTQAASITRANLQVGGVVAQNKTYDSTASATLTGTPGVTALLSDQVSVTGTASASFASKTVGNAKPVTVTGYSLTGTDADNYNVLQPTGLVANITKADLFVVGLSAANKTYDGNLSATLSGTPGVTALGLDDVQLGGSGVGSFADKTAANSKPVAVTGFTITGTDANNYNLVQSNALTANIDKAIITISGITASHKTYDGNDHASLDVSNLARTGLIGSDQVTVLVTGAFNDANAGNGKQVNLVSTYGGLDAGNYNFTPQLTTTANIDRKALGLSIPGATRTYDGSTTVTLAQNSQVTLSGVVGLDDVGLGAGTVTGFVDKNVGTNKPVVYTGFTLTGNTAGNYSLPLQPASTADITVKTLTISGSTIATKTYDGTTNATVTAGTLSGLVGTETLTVSGSGAFGNKVVGSYSINTSYTLNDAGSGATAGLASNYSLANESLNASITAKTLTISGITAASKTYDGNATASVSTSGVTAAVLQAGGMVAGDNVTVTASGTFRNAGNTADDKNVGATKTVALSSTYAGTDRANYSIVDQTSTTADITPKALTVSGSTIATKTYDGTTNATVTAGTLSGLVGTETLTVSGSGAFGNKVVGSYSINTSYTLNDAGSGATAGLASNYSLANESLNASITAKTLTISGITAASKTYDGLATASVSANTATLGGLVSGDAVTLAVSGSFADKNVGAGKAVTLSSSYSGADVGNYSISSQSSTTADITPKALTISGITAANKTYDGTTAATVSLAGLVKGGLIANDVVTVTSSGVFADKNAAQGKTVNLTNTYGGADLGNYTVSDQSTVTAHITPAALTMTAQNAAKLVGQADPVFSATYSGFVNGETPAVLSNVGVTRTGNDTAAATYTGVLVPAASSSNYTITPVSGNFTIVPADTLLVKLGNSSTTYGAGVSGLSATSAQYVTQGNVLRNVTLTAGANGSYTYSDGLGTTGSFKVTTAATSTSGVGNYGITLSNFVKNGTNFTAQTTQDGNLVVNPLAVTLGPVNVSKVYDGSLAAQTSIVVANKVGADDVSVLGTGSYIDHKNVGNAHSYSLSTQLRGAAAGNYYLGSTSVTGTDGVITPAPLTVSGITAAVKTYDGTTGATVSTAGVARSGLIGRDVVTVSSSGVFADKHAAQGKTVNLTNTYGGADLGNYSITDQVSTTADITARALTISGITAASKTYDGLATASVSANTATLGGLVSGDAVTLAVSGSFADKNVGAGKAVTLSSSYSGADVGNYSISSQSSTTADITPKALTISGITAANKTYDGTTAATVSLAGLVKGGLIANDVVTVTSSGVFADKNAAQGKTVNLTNTYGGADLGNYTVSDQSTVTAHITPAALTMTAQNAAKLVGQADPVFSATYSGFVNGETPAVLSNVGVTRTGNDTAAATYTGVLVPAASSSNYTITPVSGNFTIVPADTLLVKLGNSSTTYGAGVSGLSATSAQYVTQGNVLRNVTLTAGANGSYTYSDGLGTTGSFKVTTAATSTSGVGNYGITLSNFVKNGTNFTAQTTQDGNLVVNPLAVTLGPVNVSKVYDGSLAAQTSIVVANKVGADDVSVLGTGSYIDHKNVGNAHSYSLSTQLRGAAAGNYYLGSTSVTGTDGVITPAPLTVSGITAAVKTYDGTTGATVSTAGVARSGLIGRDVVTVSSSGVFADKHAAQGKTVNLTNTYGGADLGNYSITDQVSASASITPAPLTVSGITASDKVYDGMTSAVVRTSGMVKGGLIAGDDVTVAVTGSFANKNVGSAKAVALSSIYGGTDLGNYSVTGQASTTASVTPKALTVSGITATSKTYDGTTSAAVSTTGVLKDGLVAGDEVTVAVSGSFADRNAGNGKNVNLSSSYGGADAANYAITGQASATANITPAPLRVIANDDSKNFDGQAYSGGNGVRYSGLVNNETPSVLGGTLAFGGSSQGASREGRYAIAPYGLSSNNYNIGYEDGELTIGPSLTAASPVPLVPAVRAGANVGGSGVGVLTALGADAATYPWPPGKTMDIPKALDAGLLAITYLHGNEASPSAAAVAFEQNPDTISVRTAAAPLQRPAQDKVVFSSRLTEFMVTQADGKLVEFMGGMVNRRLVIVAPSSESKQLARSETNLVLAAAIMALGKTTPIMLAQLDDVVIDLR